MRRKRKRAIVRIGDPDLPRLLARLSPLTRADIEDEITAGRSWLVAAPSRITWRALEVFHPGVLRILLHLDTLAAVDPHPLRVHAMKREAARLRRETQRWQRIARKLAEVVQDLRAAEDRRALREMQQPAAGDPLPADVLEFAAERGHHDMPARRLRIVGVSAQDILAAYIDDAKSHADKITGTVRFDRYAGRGAWESVVERDPTSPLARASSKPERSPLHARALSRQRLELLSRSLRAAGWTHADIAELILASERDWEPAPVQITPVRRSREALVEWIRERLRDAKRANRRRKSAVSGERRK